MAGFENVKVSKLDWNDCLEPGWAIEDDGPYDLIIAADCVYHHMPAAFTAAILQLQEHSPKVRTIILSPAERVGWTMVVDRLKAIERPVSTQKWTFSCYDTRLNLDKYPIQLRRKCHDTTLMSLEIGRI
mmetsp:Transcript_48823/g.76201  ORF Transcript_48823/g.76201 Transcript_48823/m.76201 type:complete len:129 (-) Transcript_48823:39-425(-)